jgi:hypothetical protein
MSQAAKLADGGMLFGFSCTEPSSIVVSKDCSILGCIARGMANEELGPAACL